MAYKATHRFARISARKVRPLADLVRGKYADEALELLRYMPHRGARMLEKVIKSAFGNAEDLRAPRVWGIWWFSIAVSTAGRCSNAFARGLVAWRL